MSPRPFTRLGLSEGERRIALAYVILSIVGAAMAFIIAMRLRGELFVPWSARPYDMWMICAGAAGGALGLRLVQSRFGHAGAAGFGQALGGMGLLSLAAPVIAGTLALPLYGTMFGPFMMAVTFLGAPFVALIWATTLVLTHFLFATYRSERESIFA